MPEPLPALNEPTVIFVINRRWSPASDDAAVYAATRGDWKVGAATRDRARYALGIADNVVRGAYRIESWQPSTEDGRWRFHGTPAPELDAIGTTVHHLGPPPGAANPVRLYLDGVPSEVPGARVPKSVHVPKPAAEPKPQQPEPAPLTPRERGPVAVIAHELNREPLARINGSPLFSGGAGGGESNIRKWLLDNDLVEAIIGLPKDMFYNTGISTYIWVLTNRKENERKGRVQLIDGREMFTKLRKGLGSKRNELSPHNIETIVGLYAGFEDGEHSKIFRNEDFLYRTITVERSLKLNWQATPGRIDAVFEAKAIHKLSETDAAGLRRTLARLATFSDVERAQRDETPPIWRNRSEFQKALMDAAKAEGLALPSPLLKTVTIELGEQDDTADSCTDTKGNPEPDASLRDTENVPWDEDVDAYFTREVLPYAPDAWIDHTKTKEGAEIPFTRHFFQFVPPRPLEEIDRDLEAVMEQLRAMLAEVER
ncbi:MAG: N-6 DNA methylase [Microbacterium sp.]|uniref:N-6 DNA methylase n=1 Tax=Microbacterium sp. TaxID=51671 RepID=UPI00271F75FF|nr:N-6 DNA methylase [Microbacterium sp.]MDO8382810.1 N-6 DNA methylase [Microbacterium sp.]